ncbi:glycosyltransferase family 2 protein [Pararhizobium capsulatum]|nr:glycosyltransferase [Pararhizobium capsulatum]
MMFPQPKLTICVPSRNRQLYFQETIRSLLINMRTDVEFVFADNSDDPSIMNTFMAEISGDPRVKFIPSDDHIFSMVDNWERCLDTSTGEFICVIGDDDYVDVDVVDLIKDVQRNDPRADVIAWTRLTYNWPSHRPRKCVVAVPMGTSYFRLDKSVLLRDFFHWSHDAATPNNLFAIYHGAVSRRTMEKIRARFNGRYFEHPVVDFENSCKLLVTADNFIHVERPFSVLGACAESNSGRVATAADLKAMYSQFMSDIGRTIDDDAYMKDFPFPFFLGNTAAIGLCQQWFKYTYGHKAPAGWEKNFARACAKNCGMALDRENFELIAQGYRTAFENWQGGKFLQHFNPTFRESGSGKPYYGLLKNMLYIDEDIAGVQTPAELFHLVKQFISPQESMEFRTVPQFAVG